MTKKARMRPGRRRLGPLPATVLLLMLVLTAAVAVGVWHYQGEREREARQEWAQRATQELDDQIGQTGAALVAVRGLFAASNEVEKDEFARFAAIQLGRSGLLGLNWTPRVPAAGRQRFERASGVRILDRAPDGSFRPAGDRAEYFPLRYLEPETPESVSALGLDAGVYGGTPAALAISRDTGRMAMSAPIPMGATRADRGTVLVSAVYRTGAPLRTVAKRRAALRGFASGAWRYDRLAAPIVKLLPAGGRLEIMDGGETVFASGGPAGASVAESITLGGRSWTVRVSLPRGGTAGCSSPRSSARG